MEKLPIIRLTHTGGIGCYYTDSDGVGWCTTELINHTAACVACGKVTNRGYSKGKLGEEQFFYCGCNIVTVYPGLKEEARPMVDFPITLQQFKDCVDSWQERTMGETRNGSACPLHVAIQALTGETWRIEVERAWPLGLDVPVLETPEAATPRWAQQVIGHVDGSPAGEASIYWVRIVLPFLSEED